MFKTGSLMTAIATAALLLAVPALADEAIESSAPRSVPTCCESSPPPHEQRADAGAKDGAGARRAEQATVNRNDEDLFQQRPYWAAP